MNEYTISAHRVSDRRLAYTWTPNPFPTAPDTLWVEYPFDVARIAGLDVFYPVLPLFLALGFADSRFHLVSRLSDPLTTADSGSPFLQVLANWLDIVEAEAIENFGKTIHVEADVDGQLVERGAAGRAPAQSPGPGIALFLGGGAESLLALAQLTEQKLKPHLISYLGPGWIGSDPAKNENKVAMDQLVARELGLELHHVRSNMYGLFAQMQPGLWEHMVVKAFFVNRVPFTPMLVSLFAPMSNVYGLGTVYHGHEKHFEPDTTFHCFTKTFTDKLARCVAPQFSYRRILGELPKVDVFENLCTKHPGFLKYQYSCYNNEHERWCLRCEKCVRYYILFKLFDAPLDIVEFDEVRMLKNFAGIHTDIASHVWSDRYSRACYSGILSKARARGKNDVHEFLSGLIREAKRIERKNRAQALLRPLVPKPLKRLAKSVLTEPPRGTAHA